MALERVSARECIPYDQYSGATYDVLEYTLESVRQQVLAEVAGKPLRQQLIYITFEAVTGWPEPETPAA